MGARCAGGWFARLFLRTGREAVLWIVAVIVFILWLLGWMVFEIAEGLIHLLLIVALVVILYQVFTGR